MVSLESLDIEGFEDFLRSQTDLKSDDSSESGFGEVGVREFAASKRSLSAIGSGLRPNWGPGGSEGNGGISGSANCSSGIGRDIPGGGGGRGEGSPSESTSTSSSGSITACYRSSPLFNILWLRNRDDSIIH